MPLWVIYHTPDIFLDDASKQELAKDITSFYTNVGLPAFYAIVNFIPLPAGSLWKGGEIPDKPFVRMAVDHIAVRLNNSVEEYNRVTELVEKALKPHIADKGYDYEYHIDETERGLWRIDGFIPPPFNSDAEKEWARLNKAVPYTADKIDN
ncbi:putative oxalocrotonate tautomerase [Fusarium venenatum]|uniref:putative oxalocrotonate tautomerase n=1 Tax=Fusarium venenatum TaxID=56646 RepID=UPI001DDBA76B|nr:putative oxalocrotonate tautomerase [Fusarium venenatum]